MGLQLANKAWKLSNLERRPFKSYFERPLTFSSLAPTRTTAVSVNIMLSMKQ